MNPIDIIFTAPRRFGRLYSALAVALAVGLAAPTAGAGPADTAVVAVVQRTREGETITRDRLRLTPSTTTAPHAGTFSTLDPVVGHVALRDMAEGSVVLRADVGAKPEAQFRMTPTAEVHVLAHRRRGAVLPNAKQDYRRCELDTAALTPQQAAALRQELADSRVLLASPDAFRSMEGGYEDYTLAITLNGVTKSLVWSGDEAPAEARRLVSRYLDRCATQTP
jgi:hypothetical protein